MSIILPDKIRYIKLGEGGRWWPNSRDDGEVHLGWGNLDHELLQSGDIDSIEKQLRVFWRDKRGATQDFNGLKTLLIDPDDFIWITFESGFLWWCTVKKGIKINREGQSLQKGHFWLTCDRPWSNRSINGTVLAIDNLPGTVTATAGFRGTTCEPSSASQILRVVLDQKDPAVLAVNNSLKALETSVLALVNRLGPKDFEVLIDLILARSGWVRLAKIGGTREGVDVECENLATDEIAFVQVKSRGNQSVLDDYVRRFLDRLDRYDRMIFAVHTEQGKLAASDDSRIHIWNGERIAHLAVKLGLVDWIANRV